VPRGGTGPAPTGGGLYSRLIQVSGKLPRSDGRTASTRRGAAPGARRGGAVLGGVRERRVVDLLRARRHGGLRAWPHPRRLRRRGADLRLHRGVLRRGDGDVPGGGRVIELRAARVQRAGVVL